MTMRWSVIILCLQLLLLKFCCHADGPGLLDSPIQRTSTIKIGSGKSGRSSSNTVSQGRGNSSIKIGNRTKLLNSTKVGRPAITKSMTSTSIPLAYSPQPESSVSEFSNSTGTNVTKLLRVSTVLSSFFTRLPKY